MGDKLKWDEMSVRDRDALVMEKVFGWKQTSTSCRCGASIAWMKPRETGAWEMAGCVCHHKPSVTTEIAAAWQVVMEMRSDVWDMVFEIDEHMWRCSFKRPFHRHIGKAVEKTAPEAICLAALRAVGVDI